MVDKKLMGKKARTLFERIERYLNV